MKPIISVEGLGKSYTIRHEGQTRYKSLREELFKLPQRLLQRRCQNQEEFWALKDVSFDVMPGDRVGIIGRNGAGKSTLLKLLSRITEPTTGRITLRGRVASLLEVGTGFHPELTGRENIFLNGAILGMSRAEVRRKFDEIVDFAGVEKFLDTPVKRYSSGMYVRLAFAVAAHLEPEILIVDEVLAVGDAEFQKKCLGKMEEVSEEGRTVLFVSHNFSALSTLTQQSLLLEEGQINMFGKTSECIAQFREMINASRGIDSNNLKYIGSKEVFFTDLQIRKEDAMHHCENISSGETVDIIFNVVCSDSYIGKKLHFATAFTNMNTGQSANLCFTNHFTGEELILAEPRATIKCHVDKFPLSPGEYSLEASIYSWNIPLFRVKSLFTINVLPGKFQNSFVPICDISSVYVPQKWEIEL